MTNHYELTYIVPMSYTIDELPAITKKVAAILTEHGAEKLKEVSLGKLKLAYQLNKFSHGYYQVVEFDAPGQSLIEVNKALKLTNEVLRYLLVSKRIKGEEELRIEQRLREKIAKQSLERKSIFDEETDEEDTKPARKPAAPVRTHVAAPIEKEKVNMEDLDKKLDEILGGEDMLK